MAKADVVKLAEKYNGELVGGRVIVKIDGVKHYINDVGPEGAFLNLLGQQLEQGDAAVDLPPMPEPEPAPAPKAARSKKKADEVSSEPAPAPAPLIDEDEITRALSAE